VHQPNFFFLPKTRDSVLSSLWRSRETFQCKSYYTYLISTFSNYKLDFKKNEIYFTLYILSFYLYRFPSSEIIIFETCLTINKNTFFNWIQILIYHLVRVQPLQSDATPLVFIEKLFIILSFCI
jgi:hypothetical protein